MAKRSKRKRVSKEGVRKNARESKSGGVNYFDAGDGIDMWAPEEAATILMDFLPYEITEEGHPDGLEPGTLWYKLPFQVHHNVGAENTSVVCPVSKGKACPICQERKELEKDYDENEAVIKGLRTQKFVAYIIKHPEDEDKLVIFVMSKGKFANALEKELEEGDEDILNFYDVNEDGRTLKVRFSKATFEGRKYLEATRIDFKGREEMDEDEIIGKTPELFKSLNVLPYEKIKKLHLQLSENEDGDEDGAGEDPPEKDEDPEAEAAAMGEPPEEDPEPDPEPEEEPEENPEPDPEPEETKEDKEIREAEEKLAKKKAAAAAKKKKAADKKKPDKSDRKTKAADGKERCQFGGKFGVDCDKMDECDEKCPREEWEACDAAVTASKAAK